MISNTQLVPEFQHYFYDFVINSIINKNQIPFPVDINPIFLQNQSVVELLFSDTFPYNSYYYLYENKLGDWPALIRQRLMIYQSSKYLVPGSIGTNIFNLQSDDLIMLNVLLQYRHDPSSLILIDTTTNSTSIVITSDATTHLITSLTGNLNYLSTPLSKLIFLYLDLHINENYLGYYNISNIISDCSLLATSFELKLIDDYFNLISSREVSFTIICEEDEV